MPSDNTWEHMGTEVTLDGGRTFITYRIGALARALNRQPGTIRSMVTKGVLCHPRLMNKAEQWLFTRDQITDLVTLAEEEGVIDPKHRNPFTERFITQAHAILTRQP